VIPVLSAGNTDEQLERVWVDLQDCLNSSAAALLLMLAEGGNSARVSAGLLTDHRLLPFGFQIINVLVGLFRYQPANRNGRAGK
jgi:hypothetical protein